MNAIWNVVLVYDIDAQVTLDATDREHAISMLNAIEDKVRRSLKGPALRVSDTMLLSLDGLRYAQAVEQEQS